MSDKKETNLPAEKNDEEFYQELDRDRTHASCCTCQTMFLLFGFLLIISIASIFFLYYQFKHHAYQNLFNSNLKISQTLENITSQFDQFKINNAGQIVLTEDQLNTLLSTDINFRNFVFKDTITSIDADQIIVYGHLVGANSKAVISFVPKAENGKVKFESKSLVIAEIKMPGFMADQIVNNINSSLDTKLKLFYTRFTVVDVKLDNKKMIIDGTTK